MLDATDRQQTGHPAARMGWLATALSALAWAACASAVAAPLGQNADFATPTAGSAPRAIAAGPDGALWFTETLAGGGAIGRIDPLSHASTDFPTPTTDSNPSALTSGPDGATVYGVITRHDIRAVPAREVTDVRTFAQLEKEERDAAAREKDKKE